MSQDDGNYTVTRDLILKISHFGPEIAWDIELIAEMNLALRDINQETTDQIQADIKGWGINNV